MSKKVLFLVLAAVVLVGVGLGWGEILGERDGGVELVAVGDVMLGRSVNTQMQKRNDWLWPFRETKKMFSGADIVLGNLEAPLVSDCPRTDTGMIFCADARAIKGLKWAGFGVLSVANNHILNYGKKGFEETLKVLRANGMVGINGGYKYEKEINGVRVVFLGFDDVGEKLHVDQVEQVVQVAKGQNDVVVVSTCIWGNEYTKKPSVRQKELGQKLVDAGAGLVLGHHSHWVGEVEKYNRGIIVYSFGNFVFDQMWSEETRKGMMGRFWLTKEGVVDYEMSKVRIYDYGQPRMEN